MSIIFVKESHVFHQYNFFVNKFLRRQLYQAQEKLELQLTEALNSIEAERQLK